MFISILIILLTLGFTALYNFIAHTLNGLSFYFIFLWAPLGFITTILLILLYLTIMFYLVFPRLKPGSVFLKNVVRPFVKFANLLAKIHVSVEGRENIPSETFVIYANHKSMLDVTVLYEALDRPISGIAKKEVEDMPFLKQICKCLYVQYVDRENDMAAVKSMLKAIKYVKGGLNFFIFPEGGVKTREVETCVALRAGALKLATKPEATILPVSIIGTSKLTTNSFKKRTNVKVIFHKPIKAEEYKAKFIDESVSKEVNTKLLGEYVEKIINDGILNNK